MESNNELFMKGWYDSEDEMTIKALFIIKRYVIECIGWKRNVI